MTTQTPVGQDQGVVNEVDPKTVSEWLDRGDVVLMDVREGFEYGTERIEAAQHRPLSKFDPGEIAASGEKRIVFQCRTGNRSRKAATMFAAERGVPVFNLAGGIEGWKRAGLPVKRAAGAPKIDIMRQVQVTAGALVTVGAALGAFVSPWFLIISAFVGCGLMFAGLSGWCGMAKMLALMPWNRAA